MRVSKTRNFNHIERVMTVDITLPMFCNYVVMSRCCSQTEARFECVALLHHLIHLDCLLGGATDDLHENSHSLAHNSSQDAPKKKKGPTRCGPDFKWAKKSLLCEAVDQNVRFCSVDQRTS